jgi:hypothetical protein
MWMGSLPLLEYVRQHCYLLIDCLGGQLNICTRDFILWGSFVVDSEASFVDFVESEMTLAVIVTSRICIICRFWHIQNAIPSLLGVRAPARISPWKRWAKLRQTSDSNSAEHWSLKGVETADSRDQCKGNLSRLLRRSAWLDVTAGDMFTALMV